MKASFACRSAYHIVLMLWNRLHIFLHVWMQLIVWNGHRIHVISYVLNTNDELYKCGRSQKVIGHVKLMKD
jgi:hypothetical protein